MKFRVPPNCCGVTLDGVALPIIEGVVEAAASTTASLAAHGLTPADAEATDPSENKQGTTQARRGKP